MTCDFLFSFQECQTLQLNMGPHSSLQLRQHCSASVQSSMVSFFFFFQHPIRTCFQPVCLRPLPGFCVAWLCSHLSALILRDPHLQCRKSGCQKQDELSQDLFSYLIWGQFLKVISVMSRFIDEYTWIFNYKNTLHLNSIMSVTKFVAQFDICQPKLNL